MWLFEILGNTLIICRKWDEKINSHWYQFFRLTLGKKATYLPITNMLTYSFKKHSMKNSKGYCKGHLFVLKSSPKPAVR